MNAMPQLLIICLLFLFSGFAGLVFEVVWCRLLLRALGSGISANACVFAGFLAGAAIGAILAWKHCRKLLMTGATELQPDFADYLRTYGRLELIVGLSGLLISLLLNAKTEESIALILGSLGDNVWITNVCRFLICASLLFVPCACMGATFAVLGRGFQQSKTSGTFFPLLYGLNTIGAAVGASLGAFALLPTLGLRQSSMFAAGINLAIFLLVELIVKNARRHSHGGRSMAPHLPLGCKDSQIPSQDSPDPGTSSKLDSSDSDMPLVGKSLLCASKSESSVFAAAAFVSGFLAIVLELVWTRIFSMVLGSSVYSVGAVLFMVLVGAGFASLCTQLIRQRPRLAGFLVGAAFLSAALSIAATCYLSTHLQWLFVESSTYVSTYLFKDHLPRAIFSRLLLAAVFVFPSSAFLGSILALSAIAAPASRSGSGSKFYAINCLGGVCACLFFAIYLFPALIDISDTSLLFSLLWTAFICIAAACSLFLREAFVSKASLSMHYRVFSGVCAAMCVVIPFLMMCFPPRWNAQAMSSGFLVYANDLLNNNGQDADKIRLLAYKEGLNSTVSITQSDALNSISIRSDGKVEATLPVTRSIISPGSDLSTHVLLAALPVIFHPRATSKALLIGLGSGITASTLLSFPDLHSIDVAELEPAIVSACKTIGAYNGSPLDDRNKGRLRFHLDDARFVLASSANKYDLIVSQPADPWVAGSGDLFTLEFFQLASSRLNDDGLFCQWVQLYAIPHDDLDSLLYTFSETFPSTFLCHSPGAGELILVGSKRKQSGSIRNDDKLVQQKNNAILRSSRNNNLLASAGISDFYDAIGMILTDNAIVNKTTQLNTDDLPFIEYTTCRSILTGDSELSKNFTAIVSRLSNNLFIPSFQEEQEGNSARLSRIYLRQALQDGTPLRKINEERCRFEANSCNLENSANCLEINALISKHFQNNELSKTQLSKAVTLSPRTDEDRLSLFDINFEQNNLQKAAEVLAQIKPPSAESQVRQGLLLLKEGKAQAALAILQNLCKDRPCMLSALLAAAYAAYASGEIDTANSFFNRYLSINPWDYDTQLAYTRSLCKSGQLVPAFAHARSCLLLKAQEPAAFVLVLSAALENDAINIAEQSLNVLRITGSNKDAAAVLELAKRVSNLRSLIKEASFERIVNKIIVSAEDAKNGYKMLGEP